MVFRILYRFLLLAWPRHFRQDHGDESSRVFADACRESWRARGVRGVLARVARAIVEVPARGLAERRPVALLASEIAGDVRYGARSLRRSPAFTITALLTMTIGIGLCTALFTTFNAVGLRGWPAAHPDTLVLSRQGAGLGLDDLAYFQRSESLAVAGGSRRAFHSVALEPGGRGEGGFGQYVTPEFFEAVGVGMALGRNLRPDENRAGAPAPVIIISHTLWQRLFAGAQDVIGRSVYIGKRAFVIIGVTRQGWRGEQPYRDDIWLPLQTLPVFRPDDPLFSRAAGRCCLDIVGRLKPGISRERASEELSLLVQPLHEGQPLRVGLSGTSMFERASAIGYLQTAISLTMAVATGLILLLTGANIAHLQLARAMARGRETRTRLALGAGRARVVRQLVIEAMLLTVVAGALAMVLVFALIDTLMRISEMPVREVWTPNLTVYAYCVGVSLAMSIAFSLLPALRSTRVSLSHSSGPAATPSRMRFNLVLLTTQIALSVSLLTSAALLHRAFTHATRGDAGFVIDGLIAVTYQPGGSVASTREGARAFRLGVEHALTTSALPPAALLDVLPFVSVSTARVRLGDQPQSVQDLDLAPMSASAFAVLGIGLTDGRVYSDDTAGEVVVNQTAARRLWPDGSALGRTLVYDKQTYTVVGVARDVHYASRERIRPMLHLPAGTTRQFPAVVLRGDARTVTAQVTALIHRLDPQAVVNARSLSDRIASGLGDERLGAQAAWAGGALALALATFGVFGVFSYVVEERRREIGIRVALGAERGAVLRAIFRPARRSVLAGLGIGLVLALLSGPILQEMGIRLFGMSPFDPVAFATAGAILAAAALIATFIPARRALAVEPAVILKEDG
jgi:predicted permease